MDAYSISTQHNLREGQQPHIRRLRQACSQAALSPRNEQTCGLGHTACRVTSKSSSTRIAVCTGWWCKSSNPETHSNRWEEAPGHLVSLTGSHACARNLPFLGTQGKHHTQVAIAASLLVDKGRMANRKQTGTDVTAATHTTMHRSSSSLCTALTHYIL